MFVFKEFLFTTYMDFPFYENEHNQTGMEWRRVKTDGDSDQLASILLQAPGFIKSVIMIPV